MAARHHSRQGRDRLHQHHDPGVGTSAEAHHVWLPSQRCQIAIDKWAAPKYWAEVEYRDITTDGLLRHVTFMGLYANRTAKTPLLGKFKT